MLLLAPALCFLLLVAGMFAVGLVSWKRTRSVRRGAFPGGADRPRARAFTSSRMTLLAALAGVAAAGWGAAAAGRRPIEGLLLVAWGAFIVGTGSVGRVTEVRAGDEGLLVHFAARSPFRARWAEILRLHPPGTPVGGWRLTAVGGTGTTLMPSDLFGHEDLLCLIVERSGLTFDGRMWIRESGRQAIR